MPLRPRQPTTTVSTWSLSLFAVYSAVPLLLPHEVGKRLNDQEEVAAQLLYVRSPAEELTVERRGRLMGTVMGVAGFTQTFGVKGAAGEMAVHSSRRRMVWIEPEPGFFIHATIALPRPARHSRRASAATISSANSAGEPPAGGLDNDVLIATLNQGYRDYRLRCGSITARLEREGKEQVTEELEGFWRGWTDKWELGGTGATSGIERVLDAAPRCSLLTPHISSQLLPLIAQFAANNSSTLPILLHDSKLLSLPHLPPSSASSPQYDSDTTPTRAKKPSPPSLTEDDLLALVRLLSSLTTTRSTLSIHSDPLALPNTPFPPLHPLAESALSPALEAEHSNRWTASFSNLTDGFASLVLPSKPLPSVTLPSLPSFGSSSSAAPSASATKKAPPNLRAGFKALRQQEQEARASAEAQERARTESAGSLDGGGGWTLKNVGWSSLGFGGSGGGAGAKSAKAVKAAAAVSSAQVEVAAQAASVREDGEAPSERKAEGSAAENFPLPSAPTTPAVELAPTVDVSELAEALGPSPTPASPAAPATPLPSIDVVAPLDSGDAGGVTEVEEEKPVEEEEERVEKKLALFCGSGEGREKFCLRWYERGSLTLALVFSPLPPSDDTDDTAGGASLAWMNTKAERLLEAVESVLEVVVPPKPSYPHRHVVKHGIMVSSFLPPPETTSATDEAEASLAILESFRALKSSPSTLESLTRLSNSQWVVHRRSLDPSSPFSSSSSCSHHGSAAAPTTHPTDVYSVLPAKTSRGKDASLLDAAEELRKVSRAYL